MANRTHPSVYLAGPITGQSYEGAVDWREYAKAQLAAAGIIAFSPMRQKEYLSREQVINGAPEAYGDQILSRPKGIVTRDRNDTRTVDLVLMNLLPAEQRLREINDELYQLLRESAAPEALTDRIVKLFNNGRGVISIGTMIEAGWADAFRTPLIVVMSAQNPHRHAMLVELAGYVVEDLDSGIALAKSILLPG